MVGDQVCFEKATFKGGWRNPRFAGNEIRRGTIIRDSYGRDKQQHTFTIEELAETPAGEWWPTGETFRIKGRNLYRNGVHRKPWVNESDRQLAANEKHQRGDQARMVKEFRKSLDNPYAIYPDSVKTLGLTSV